MSEYEVISAKAPNGETRYGVLEVRPVAGGKVMAVVHYGPKTEADSRTWGTDAEEQRNMRVCDKAKLLDLMW